MGQRTRPDRGDTVTPWDPLAVDDTDSAGEWVISDSYGGSREREGVKKYGSLVQNKTVDAVSVCLR
jgi:hypothetical protein